MVVEYIRYEIGVERADAFMADYARAAELLNRSPFCRRYELTRCEEEPAWFLLRIEWTSTKDHLEGFRKSGTFPEFFALVKPYFAEIREMRHYAVTEVVGSGAAR